MGASPLLPCPAEEAQGPCSWARLKAHAVTGDRGHQWLRDTPAPPSGHTPGAWATTGAPPPLAGPCVLHTEAVAPRSHRVPCWGALRGAARGAQASRARPPRGDELLAHGAPGGCDCRPARPQASCRRWGRAPGPHSREGQTRRRTPELSCFYHKNLISMKLSFQKITGSHETRHRNPIRPSPTFPQN